MDLYVETEKVRHIIVRGEGGRGDRTDRQVVELVGSVAGRQAVGRWKWE